LENGGLAVRGAVVAITLGKATGPELVPNRKSCENLGSPTKKPDAGLATTPACSRPLHRWTAEGTHVGVTAVTDAIGPRSNPKSSTKPQPLSHSSKPTNSTNNDTEMEHTVAAIRRNAEIK